MKTVLVTRPKNQAGAFVSQLEEHGLGSVVFPTIEIKAVEGWVVPDLSDFDGIFFTSPNSVSAFMARLLSTTPEQLENLQKATVWAVGKTTAGDLLTHGITTEPVPKIADAVTMMSEIGEERIAGKNFLFLRGNLSLGVIPDVIGKRGGQCTELTVYENRPPSLEDTAAIKAMLAEGRLDCLSFTSPSTATNFFEAMGTTGLPDGVKIAAIGTTTARALEKIGIKTDIIPEYFDGPNFARAIAEALR
ncbi:uroporphyrinogen-III synthase [Chlorobium phaeovibrioides]|uniref:Uroporphyrinogen-III synthase n=1 Tax=Chlorobium phaeovibrioides TaxID=1094 RepID=A0A432AVL8_CHLPH|nr:uroporphyrinogen-III synthase [Chlorobium phaeovibrioides]KAA6232897.1 uroporphyrinogen-III synthase [Chlorobium phaeovibrioides]MWV54564.1 uroporphyrinogen-III synthase [Chlorobium phaeovibrioides]RTY35353.1 uroporphyrinogen-III synthase [Chlorobium phaeovibrioides]RTY38899.1 uroporphyrinogen-III synthase [Chlorobium phaeovibrioides]